MANPCLLFSYQKRKENIMTKKDVDFREQRQSDYSTMLGLKYHDDVTKDQFNELLRYLEEKDGGVYAALCADEIRHEVVDIVCHASNIINRLLLNNEYSQETSKLLDTLDSLKYKTDEFAKRDKYLSWEEIQMLEQILYINLRKNRNHRTDFEDVIGALNSYFNDSEEYLHWFVDFIVDGIVPSWGFTLLYVIMHNHEVYWNTHNGHVVE
jgi:hypothetical protein